MKLTITLKDPDCLCEPVRKAVTESLAALHLSECDVELLSEARETRLNETLRTWFEYGEYCRVEVDTEAMTATVLRVKS